MLFVKSFLRLSSPNYCCRHIYDVVSNLMKYESVDAVVLYTEVNKWLLQKQPISW